MWWRSVVFVLFEFALLLLFDRLDQRDRQGYISGFGVSHPRLRLWGFLEPHFSHPSLGFTVWWSSQKQKNKKNHHLRPQQTAMQWTCDVSSYFFFCHLCCVLMFSTHSHVIWLWKNAKAFMRINNHLSAFLVRISLHDKFQSAARESLFSF